jgi:ABC-type transport system substrate-binding protein
VPKRYVEKVGDEALKKQPIGLGPHRVVSNQPSVELVLEAYRDYWGKPPHVKPVPPYRPIPITQTDLISPARLASGSPFIVS